MTIFYAKVLFDIPMSHLKLIDSGVKYIQTYLITKKSLILLCRFLKVEGQKWIVGKVERLLFQSFIFWYSQFQLFSSPHFSAFLEGLEELRRFLHCFSLYVWHFYFFSFLEDLTDLPFYFFFSWQTCHSLIVNATSPIAT